MAFFKKILKSKANHQLNPAPVQQQGPNYISSLPDSILKCILVFVCPLVTDSSPQPCEYSLIGNGCASCDTRDLANCAQVSSKWNVVATPLLYSNILIDILHGYECGLEDKLREKRPHTLSDPLEVPAHKLRLLQRTLRNSSSHSAGIISLKMPPQIRSSCVNDLARIVSILPNLQYVDLSEHFFRASLEQGILRQELRVNCPQLKWMGFETGSEQQFDFLVKYHFWNALESLELSKLNMNGAGLLFGLATLPQLKNLYLKNCDTLDNTIFHQTSQSPFLPPMQTLRIEGIPHISSTGFASYCARSDVKSVLTSLTIDSCVGIRTNSLHTILPLLPNLVHLCVAEDATQPFPLTSELKPPPLCSTSLKNLYYEITNNNIDDASKLSRHYNAETHHVYLAATIHLNTLPALRKLFVRELAFPGRVMALSTAPSSSLSSIHRPDTPPRPLEIYTKSPDNDAWLFASDKGLSNPFGTPTKPDRLPPALNCPPQAIQDGTGARVVGMRDHSILHPQQPLQAWRTYTRSINTCDVLQPHSPSPWRGHAQKTVLLRVGGGAGAGGGGTFVVTEAVKGVKLAPAYTRSPGMKEVKKEGRGWFRKRVT